MEPMLPVLLLISGESLIWVVVQVVIAGVIFYVLNWGLAQIPVQEPFKTVIKVIMVLMVCFFLINALLTLGGRPLIKW